MRVPGKVQFKRNFGKMWQVSYGLLPVDRRVYGYGKTYKEALRVARQRWKLLQDMAVFLRARQAETVLEENIERIDKLFPVSKTKGKHRIQRP